MTARFLPLVSLLALVHPHAVSAQNPAPRIELEHALDGMTVRLPGDGAANSWTLEASGDLAHWVELGELLETAGTAIFPDTAAHGFGNRYYRAIHHGRDIQAALDRNRARWEARGLENYDFTFQWLCFCVPDYIAPVHISVRNGDITAVSRVEDGEELDPSVFGNYRTMDGLFDLLQEAIDLKAHRISARFAPRTGAPRRAWIDYDPRLADEERGFVVTNLQAAGAKLVQITDTPPAELQIDPFTLQGASIRGHTLTLTISYGGGCAEHDFELFMSPAAFMESFPVQADLYLRHNANGDLCKALLTTELDFDLTPIAELPGVPGPIILNIHDYFTGDPGDRISVTYEP